MLWAITGGSGYVGLALAAHLRENGHGVRLLSKTPAHHAFFEIVEGDIRDPAATEKLIAGADVVVHLAAYVHRPVLTSGAASECYAVNVLGTQTLIDAVARSRSSPFLIYASTANVYPSSDTPSTERTAPAPKTFYGTTKLEGEIRVGRAVNAGLIRATVLRPAMVVGRGAPGNLRRLASQVRRGWCPLVGRGDNRKSLTTIATLVGAIHDVASDPARTNGEVWNVATASASMRQIAERMAEAAGVRPRYVLLPRRPLLWSSLPLGMLSRALKLPDVQQMIRTYASNDLLDITKGAAIGLKEDRAALFDSLSAAAHSYLDQVP